MKVPQIRIRKTTSKSTNLVPSAVNVKENTNYQLVDLVHLLQDSCIAKVWLHIDCIQSIMHWVEISLEKKPVHEVGGFLLGRILEQHKKPFQISIDRFVAATTVDESSPNLLDFGSKALLTLEKEREKYSDLQLIGWFHTHPGHTPYLSHTDLRLHHGFFAQAYYIALVLDSLTAAFDTGFFSWKSNGEMNNQADTPNWISWKQLHQQAITQTTDTP